MTRKRMTPHGGEKRKPATLSLRERVAAVQDEFGELQAELEDWSQGIPENMEEKRSMVEAASDTVTGIADQLQYGLTIPKLDTLADMEGTATALTDLADSLDSYADEADGVELP
jgi:hypothetical protein